MKRKITLLAGLCLISALGTTQASITIPSNPNKILLINNPSISAKKFYSALQGKKEQRHLAQMYLIGVIDSIDPSSWCGYQVIKPHEVHAFIYEVFKSLTQEQSQQPAAKIIKNSIKTKMSCKEI